MALEPTAANLQALAGVLQVTLGHDNKAIKEASAQLKELEARQGYSLCLLQLISMAEVSDPQLKLCAAIAFKNFVLRCWDYDGSEAKERGQPDPIAASDRATIKQHLIALMAAQPKAIQNQLGQSLALVSRVDFPQQWPALLPELVARIEADGRPEELVGVLEVMHSIFFRYRHELKSQKLWEEIALVLAAVCEPLSKLFLRWVARLSDPAYSTNAATLPVIIQVLALITDNFLSLNSQDIAAQFEEPAVLGMWFNTCLELLSFSSPLLEPKNAASEDATQMDTLKATICDIVNLFTWKYEDQIAPFVPKFATSIWTLLTSLGDAKRFDLLVNSAVKFLTSVVRKDQFKQLFAAEGTLQSLCEKVIIPQLRLRDTDLEVFEYNAQEYIRIDIEGSDVDTRRRTSVDFIHGLTMQFEESISTLLKGYVTRLLAEYDSNRKAAFLSKDAAMYIVLALSAKKSSVSKGITETNKYVDIGAFFTSQVVPELSAAAGAVHPLVLADCLKYLSVFRQQLPKEYCAQLLPLICTHLASESVVIHTYAAYAIERMLAVKEGSALRFDKEFIRPKLQQLLVGLFTVLDQEESKENEYVMKAIMRVCSVGQDAMVPFAQTVLSKITSILSYVCLNPRNPKFNHSLFETVAALIKYLCQSNAALIAAFEAALFPPLQQLLSLESAAEFSPYVFQLMAQLLELRADTSAPYQGMFPTLLRPAIWANSGNVPAVTRLLQAYLRKPGAWALLFQGNTLFNGLLGVFQELLRLKSTEVCALELLTSVCVDLELSHTAKDLQAVFSGFLFPRLQPAAKPTPRLFKATVALFLAFLARQGLDAVRAVVDAVQPGLFAMLLDKIVLANVGLLQSEQERRLGVVALTALLAQTPSFLADQAYVHMWPRMLLAAVKLQAAKASKDASSLAAALGGGAGGAATGGVADDDDADDLLQQSEKGFSTAYARLVFAAGAERDYSAPLTAQQPQQSPASYCAQQLQALFRAHAGKFGAMLAQLPAADQDTVRAFFTANNIAL